MKKIATLLFFAFIVTLAKAGHIVTDSIQSKVLHATVKYNVYLPKGFEKAASSKKAGEAGSLPVIYLLHGLTDDHTAWRDRGQMQTVADELIESGEMQPTVIVMPCAGGPDIMKTWNGYLNMPGWAYEDFFFTEFLPTIEQRYHIIADKAHRAIMGLSMGGGGSAIYAQRHPDMFSSCYIMSGWLGFEGSNKYPKDSRPYLLQESLRTHHALRFVDNATEATLAQLRTLKWFIDCGDDDFLFDLNVGLHQAMRKRGVKDELRIRNGVHNWEYWHTAIRTAFPFASRHFAK